MSKKSGKRSTFKRYLEQMKARKRGRGGDREHRHQWAELRLAEAGIRYERGRKKAYVFFQPYLTASESRLLTAISRSARKQRERRMI